MLLAVKVAMEAVAAEVASLVVARWAELEAANKAAEAAVQRVVCPAAVEAEKAAAPEEGLVGFAAALRVMEAAEKVAEEEVSQEAAAAAVAVEVEEEKMEGGGGV